MGIAIHIIVEVQQENPEWLAITGDTWVPRNGQLFSAIAFGDDGSGDNLPYPPRGLPEDYSVGVRNSYFFPAENGIRLPQWNKTKQTLIWKMIKSPARIEKMLPDKVEREAYRKYRLFPGEWVTGTNWLTLAELEVALRKGRVMKEEHSTEFTKVLSVLTKAAKKSGKDKVRMVFWFSR
ncbi:MAG TPA: hypothetical protein VFD58_09005 [Blastocatellia bacterium]|nr:hypothetical protein [Blastocatellia bacterium]